MRYLKMKKISLLIVLLFVAGLLYAHPPKSVDVSFDLDEHMLKVVVVHSSKDRTKHYINKVHVKINGKDSIVQTLTIQSEGNTHIYSYIMPDVKVGDEIYVDADCNVFGDKSVKITVKKAVKKLTKPKSAQKLLESKK